MYACMRVHKWLCHASVCMYVYVAVYVTVSYVYTYVCVYVRTYICMLAGS